MLSGLPRMTFSQPGVPETLDPIGCYYGIPQARKIFCVYAR